MVSQWKNFFHMSGALSSGMKVDCSEAERVDAMSIVA
jgi:hypothetical protein